MEKETIRNAIRSAGVRQWQVADVLGVREETLCRWLRKDVDENRARDILSAITLLVKGA